MKNKKILILFVIIVLILIVIFSISKKQKQSSGTEKTKGSRNETVEAYVRDHYLKSDLLDYMIGEVSQENKIAYSIDQINKQNGKRKKEITRDELKGKYSEIFAEDLEITEAAFMLSNNYEFEESRGTFLDKSGNDKIDDRLSVENQNILEVTDSEYDKESDKYIVTINEKSGSEDNVIVVKTTKMELKNNGHDGYIITDYYKEK